MSSSLMKRQVRQVLATSLSNSPQPVGAVVTITARKIAIVNSSDVDVQISDQTSNDPFYLPAGSTIAVGEGISGWGQNQYAQWVVPAQTIYQATIVTGSATTGSIVITVEGY